MKLKVVSQFPGSSEGIIEDRVTILNFSEWINLFKMGLHRPVFWEDDEVPQVEALLLCYWIVVVQLLTVLSKH